MARFGQFETVRELSGSGDAAIYSARGPDAGGERYAVKVCKPLTMMYFEVDEKSNVQQVFVGTSELQQALGRLSPHWAPVHDFGETDEGAYRVMDLYPRSLEWAVGRIQISAEDLLALLTSAVEGLVALREAFGRPHGDLKPSNILLRDPSAIAKAGVVLTDPLPANLLSPAEHERADLESLGMLIYEFVMGSPFYGNLPKESSAEWTRFAGKRGDTWRRLCCELLNRNPAESFITLDATRDALRQLQARRRSRLLPVAVGLLVLVGVTAGVLFATPIGKRVFGRAVNILSAINTSSETADAWGAYCREYHRWFGAFVRDVSREPEPDAWLADDRLEPVRKLVGDAAAGGTPFDPRAIVDRSGVDAEGLAEDEAALKALAEPAVGEAFTAANDVLVQTREGLKSHFVRQLEAQTTSESGQTWPAFTQLVARTVARVQAEPDMRVLLKTMPLLLADLDQWPARYGAVQEALTDLDSTKADLGTAARREFDQLLKETMDPVMAPFPPADGWSPKQCIQLVTTVLDGLNDFRADVDARVVANTVSPQEWEQVLMRHSYAAAPVQQLWVRWRSEFLRTLRADPEAFRDVRLKTEARQRFLAGLQSACDPREYALPDDLPEAWKSAVDAELQQRHEAFVRGLVKAVVDADTSLGTWEEFAAGETVRRLRDDGEAYRRRLLALPQEAAAVTRAIRHWSPLEATLPAVGETLRATVARWRDERWERVAAVGQLLSPVVTDVAALEEVDRETRRSTLSTLAADDALPGFVRHAAYLRLGTLEDPLWPSENDEKATESRLAGAVQALADQLPAEARDRTVTAIAAEARRRQALGSIAEMVAELRANAVQLRASGDDVLRRFADHIDTVANDGGGDARTRARDLAALSRTVADVADAVERELKGGTLDLEFLRQEQPLYANRAPVGVDAVEAWLAALADARRLKRDPRQDRQWDEELTQSRREWERVKELNDVLVGFDDDQARQVSEALTRADRLIAALAPFRPVQKNATAIEAAVDAAQAALDRAKAEVARLGEKVPSADEWLRDVRGRETLCESAVLNTEWQKRVAAVLGGIETGSQLTDDATRFAQVHAGIQRLRDVLLRLDETAFMPRSFPPQALADRAPADQERLRQRLVRRRERALADVLASVHWRDGLPLEDADAVAALDTVRQRVAAYRDWLADPVETSEETLREALTTLNDMATARRRGSPVRGLLTRFLGQVGAAFAAGVDPQNPDVGEALAAVRSKTLEILLDGLPVRDPRYADQARLGRFTSADQEWLRALPYRLTVPLGAEGDDVAGGIELVLLPRGGQDAAPIYVGRHELCYGEYRRFAQDVLGETVFRHRDQPVAGINYTIAARYCNWVASRTGRTDLPYECTLDDEDASEPSEWRTATASGALRLPTGNEWQLLRTYALAAGEAGTGSPWFKEQAGDRGRYSRRRETDHGEVQPNELGIHHLLGNVAELRHELEGTAVRREVVLGGHVALSEEDVLANEYQQEVYWDEDHDHIGFRLILEVRIR